jgi:hypothetical protein
MFVMHANVLWESKWMLMCSSVSLTHSVEPVNSICILYVVYRSISRKQLEMYRVG